jgi:hypothetical protein
MGQYFKIVNPAKRQYLDADSFNENIKASGILQGNHAIAVAVLVCNFEQVRDGWGNLNHDYGPLAGSWCGDPVYIVGDEETAPNAFGVRTSTEANPTRNLYWLAKEEFDNISYQAIAMLCQGRPEFAEEIVQRALDGPSAERNLVNLGNVVFLFGSDRLVQALEKGYGKDWKSRYKQVWQHPS